MQTRLLLATGNPAKLREYKSLLQDLPFELVTPEEAGVRTRVHETGNTLEENAVLKAKTMAAESGLLSLADDSGLEVDALGGEPGARSARYAGEGASDEERISFLLGKLKGIPLDRRTARFRAVIAIATPEGKAETRTGECRGLIALEPRGDEGFGYDPVFYLPELGKTMAELPSAVKNQISHRARAARQIKEVLDRLQVAGTNG